MTNSVHYSAVEGDSLLDFVESVRFEFRKRDAYSSDPNGLRFINSVRSIAVELFDLLSDDQKVVIVRDLIVGNDEILLLRPFVEVFETAGSPADYITDLICEIVWQVLMEEEDIRHEDKARQSLANDSPPAAGVKTV